MSDLPFWVFLSIGILASLVVSIVYARRAIHPRLRPHFGQVVVVFLILVLISLFFAYLLGKLTGRGELPPESKVPASGQPTEQVEPESAGDDSAPDNP